MLRCSILFLALTLLPAGVIAERSTSRDNRVRAAVGQHRARRQVGLGLSLVQLEPASGFQVREPARAWGTVLTVARLREALAAYRTRFPDARPVLIHDLSREGGGRLLPHHSHRRGRDVDVEIIRTARGAFDVERTWYLIQALLGTGDVEYVFLNRRLVRPLYRHAKARLSKAELGETFQWPRRGWTPGIVRDEPGHLRHFHVRFNRDIRAAAVASAAVGWQRSEPRLGPRALVSLEPL